ncbi:MAG: SBBP repeat-containing protein, partial [Terracidiphilus sp.]
MANFRVRAGAGIGFPVFVLLGSLLYPAASGLAADRKPGAPSDESQRLEAGAAAHGEAGKLLGSMPLFFVPNAGQADPSARFVARGRGYELDLRENALAITALTGHKSGPLPTPIVLKFVGANPAPQLEGASPSATRINYIIGNDPKQWHRGLSTYRQVRYANLYPGIDLVCYGADGGKLEYDLVVAPGADPQQIRFSVGSGHTASIAAGGDLEVDGAQGPLSLGQPVFYQNVPHGKRAIFGSFVDLGNGEFGFHAVHYDRTLPLVIDPPVNILYSTYFGGSLDDEAAGMAIDSQGNSYVAGGTNSVDMLSTSNALQPGRGAPTAGYQVTNAFIAKFDPSGTLLYGTYLGGSNLEWAGAIAVDAQGDAYVTGLSSSSDFPTTANAYSAAGAYGNQMFISEISPDGSTLEYSTIYGVAGTSSAIVTPANVVVTWGNMGIAVSAQNTIYVSSSAYSGLPTSLTAYMGSLPSGYLGYAAFAAEFDPAQLGSKQLLAATYFTAPTPSSGQHYSNVRYYGTYSFALTLDPSGNVWIGGEDQTGALPTTSGAHQQSVTLGNPSTICNSSPVISAPWFAEFSSDLSQLKYATYFSGGTTAQSPATCNEWVQGLASGTDGSIYVVGNTPSASFPTTSGALQTSYPGPTSGTTYLQSFISKFAPGAASLVWSTYLGQTGGASVIAGAPFIDAQSNVWVPGELTGPAGNNFPLTSNDLGACGGASCAFVTAISSNGASTVFSTAIGSSLWPTFATGVGIDSAGNIHIAGTTNSTSFPLSSNAAQTQLNAGLYALAGDGDWFFTILGSGTVSVVGEYVGGNDGDDTITLAGTGFQQGATCSLVSGGITIASTASAVSPDGTGIICTFPLEGAALGNYNIVVTEPGGSTVTKQNGFTVQQGQGPDVWVNLTGRSHLRSALPSTMTVTYGNSGDTDALGVPIFVTIPTGVTVQVLSTLLVPPDSDPLLMSTVPLTVTIGGNTVLPLFVPRIAAGSSGSVQIQVTPPSTDTDITLTAYNWEPIATSASDLETDLGTYQNGNLNPLLRASRHSVAPDVYTLVLDPVTGSKCFQDVILLAFQVATNLNPVAPGLKCTSSVVSFLSSAVTTLINSQLSSDYSSSDAASDLGQMYAGGAQAALNCVETAAGSTPAGMAVKVIATLLQNAIPIANTLSDCSQVASINNSSAKNSTVGGAIDPNDKSGP